MKRYHVTTWYRITLHDGGGPETGDFLADPDKALRRYAEDIEVNYSTLQKYRRTAEVWPERARARASWRTRFLV